MGVCSEQEGSFRVRDIASITVYPVDTLRSGGGGPRTHPRIRLAETFAGEHVVMNMSRRVDRLHPTDYNKPK